MAIVFAALVFMMLHVYAYGSGSYTTNISAYISAFTFAIIVDMANWILQNAITSRMAHAVNNLTITCVMLNISIFYGIAILVIYILFLSITGNRIGSKTFTRQVQAYIPVVD